MNEREPFSDELISAYLDGELTADEQDRVERMLAENDEYRQMFDEFSALRDSLQSLPQYRLDEEFHLRVLQRAERAMLSEPSPTPAEATPASVSRAEPSAESERGSLRGAFWALAVLAAAVLLMLFSPKDRNKDLAIKDAPPPAGTQKTVDNVAGAKDAEKLAETSTGGSLAPENRRLGRDIAGKSARREFGEETSKRALGELDKKLGAPGHSDDGDAERFAESGAAKGLSGKDAVDRKKAQGRSDFGGGGFGGGGGPRSEADSTDAFGDDAPDVAHGQGAGRALRQVREGLEARKARSTVSKRLPAIDALVKQVTSAGLAGAHVTVVNVNVASSAFQQQAFDEALSRQAIRLLATPEDVEHQRELAARFYSFRSVAKNELERIEGITADGALAGLTIDDNVDLVYIEAPVAQVRGLLNDLKSRPDTFLAMTVETDRDKKEDATSFEYLGSQLDRPVDQAQTERPSRGGQTLGFDGKRDEAGKAIRPPGKPKLTLEAEAETEVEPKAVATSGAGPERESADGRSGHLEDNRRTNDPAARDSSADDPSPGDAESSDLSTAPTEADAEDEDGDAHAADDLFEQAPADKRPGAGDEYAPDAPVEDRPKPIASHRGDDEADASPAPEEAKLYEGRLRRAQTTEDEEVDGPSRHALEVEKADTDTTRPAEKTGLARRLRRSDLQTSQYGLAADGITLGMDLDKAKRPAARPGVDLGSAAAEKERGGEESSRGQAAAEDRIVRILFVLRPVDPAAAASITATAAEPADPAGEADASADSDAASEGAPADEP